MKEIILFNQNMNMGGVEKVTLNLLKNLDRTKFKVKLILVEKKGELLSEIPEDVEVISLLEESLVKNKTKVKKIYCYIYELFLINKKLKELNEKKQIFLIMNSRNFRLNFSLKKFKNKKIGWIHGNILNDFGRFLEKLNYKLFNQYTIIYNVSKEGKVDFDSRFPSLKNKSRYLYNSFDIEKIEEKSNELFNINEKYLLSVGRLTSFEKGYDILIESIKLLKETNINIKLYILGDGPDRENLENKISQLNLQENIKIIGFENNPYKWMKNAELFILSSRGEGLPTVLIEALACKVPIVSTNCKCGPAEILKDGENGILVSVGDAEALKNGIKKILMDEDLKKYLKEKSFQRALDFSNKKIIKDLEEELLGL